MTSQPALAQSGVDTVTFNCNGTDSSQGVCTLFQLDGSQGTANGDTCVGGETICPAGEQNPKWPADWDALFFPGLEGFGGVSTAGSGTPPGPYSFNLPWNAFGSFSGVIPSTLVTNNISTILKQGSKNNNDISTWVVASQSSPPKDAYLAGAIADYIAPPGSAIAGHQLIYLSSTRFAPNGSATIGIWFFQQNVEICKTGPNAGSKFCVAGTTTLATHQNKDLFLFLSFSGAGDATIVPAEWLNGSLVQNSALTTCPSSGAQGCAVTNNVTSITLGNSTGNGAGAGIGFNVSGPGWPGFPGGVVPVNQFQETGLDFNAIFGGTAPCFSSVMFASVTSGSSPGTASLKSILLGSFNTCAITVNKTCGTGTPNTSAGTITYPVTGVVENVGGGTTSNLVLTDTFNGNSQPFDSAPTCTCGPSGCTNSGGTCSSVSLGPGGTVTYNATITVSSNGGMDIVHATMGGGGGGSASADSNVATCNSLTFSTGVTISKACTTGAQLVPVPPVNPTALEVQVGVGGTVTATGDFGLTSIKVYDCVGGAWQGMVPNIDPTKTTSCSGTITGPMSLNDLLKAGSEPWNETYTPTKLVCGLNIPFSDTALVTASCTSTFCPTPTVENISNVNTCNLCPGAACTP
jgi:hypothetical protein